MCSCFLGTQNALFLSASSRSCDCQHTPILRSCISDAVVPLHRFRRRMQLANGPANFAVSHQYGATVVCTVLYQSVFPSSPSLEPMWHRAWRRGVAASEADVDTSRWHGL